MIITTTQSIQGHEIREYKGLVSGEVIFGLNFVKDFFASVRDFVGGRSNTYEKAMVDGREQAQREMEQRARAMGANAIVGVSYGYETVGANGSMLLVSISGTAVVIELVSYFHKRIILLCKSHQNFHNPIKSTIFAK